MIIPMSHKNYADEIHKSVRAFLRMAEREKQPFTEDWGTFQRYYENRHWRDKDARRDKMTANYITPAILNDVYLLMDNRPRPQVISRSFEVEVMAWVMQELVNHKLDEGDFESSLTKALVWMNVLTRGIIKDGYDSQARKMFTRAVNPNNLMADPFAEHIDKAAYVVERYPMFIEDAVDKWPDHAKDLKPDAQMSEILSNSKGEDDGSGDFKIIYQIDKANYGKGDGRSSSESWVDSDRVWINEIWTKDPISYPNWRLTYYACDKVLEDTHNPLMHKDCPYSDIPNFEMDRFWTLSTVDFLLSIQRKMNRNKTMISDTIDAMGNPKIIADISSIQGKLTNQPGAIIFKKPGSEVRFEPGTPIPPQYFQAVEGYKGDIAYILSQFDPVRGKGGGGVRSWGAVEALQDASLGRIRGKGVSLYRMIQRIAFHMLFNIQQYDTEPYPFRIMRPDGTYTYIDYKPEYSKYQYEVLIGTAPAMPISRTARSNLALQLFAMHGIDQEEMLKSIDWPNRQEVLMRMRQQQMQQMMMSGMQGGGSPGIGSPGSQRPAAGAALKGGRSNLPLMKLQRQAFPMQM